MDCIYINYSVKQSSKEGTLAKEAQGVSKKLCKPSKVEAHVLKSLFLSSSFGGKRQSRPFDPTSVSCASSSQKKKKAANAQGRATNVQVMLLKDCIPNIPRGLYRNELKSEGRVQTIQFKRSMSTLEVKNQIIRGFRHIDNLQEWDYLQTDTNHLHVASNQQMDGNDVISRKEFLYLSEKVCIKAVISIYSGVVISYNRQYLSHIFVAT